LVHSRIDPVALAEIELRQAITDAERPIRIAERVKVDADVEGRPVTVAIAAPIIAAIVAPVAVPAAARPPAAVAIVLLVARPLAEIAIAILAPAAAVARPATAALGLLDLLRLCAAVAAAVSAIGALGPLLFGDLLRRALTTLEARAVELARLPLHLLLLNLLLAHLKLLCAVRLRLPCLEATARAFGPDLLARLTALFADLLTLLANLLTLLARLLVLRAIRAVVMVSAVLRDGRRSGSAG